MVYLVYIKRSCECEMALSGVFLNLVQAERCIEDAIMMCGVDYVDYYIQRIERNGRDGNKWK